MSAVTLACGPSALGTAACAYTAGEALGRAVPVFPLAPAGKVPHPGLPRCGCGEGGFKLATADLDRVAQWWRRWPRANIGGAIERALLVVIDIEGPGKGHDPERTLVTLQDAFGALAPTLTARTAGGGLHLFYGRSSGSGARSMPLLRDQRGAVIPGGELKATGYVVLSPSRLPGGGGWRFLNNEPIATAPAWMTPPPGPERTTAPPAPRRFHPERDGTPWGMAALAGEVTRLLTAGEGHRHSTLFLAARAIGMVVSGGELEGAHAIAELRAAATRAGLDGPRAPERERTLADGLAAGLPYPRRAPRGAT